MCTLVRFYSVGAAPQLAVLCGPQLPPTTVGRAAFRAQEVSTCASVEEETPSVEQR